MIEKLLNKFGYYKLADRNYLVDEDTKPRIFLVEPGKFNREAVEAATKQLLTAMGQDVNRPGLKETPRRVGGYWQELLEGEQYTNKQIAKMYSKYFDVGSSNLVIKEVENVFSHCEHHLALMYNGTVYVAYIPRRNRDGSYKVIGLSKIDRIVHMCSKRLQLQEKLAQDIAECIQIATGSDSVYVQIIMNHGCVSARGPKSQGKTDVTYLTKNLKRNIKARQEIETKIANLINK